ncbi:type II toxin-antitoxin system HigB family toxin [uncultured Rikenella sp.]|uniref:type II toxin-antitoxin system HigB family toxin n=1 Tax=uncultured Rikenella sp. TaxID=368003 RepID=UPI00272CA678|nr:type II toxin-antitoxin system HigB family toxin [uncultured Rikenella sp.]
MRVISFASLRSFIEQHADADIPMRDWYKKTSRATWNSLADIRKTFNSADYVGNKRYVFNVKGNNYRIVAMIFFEVQQLYIRFVGTHAEYDNIDCKNI